MPFIPTLSPYFFLSADQRNHCRTFWLIAGVPVEIDIGGPGFFPIPPLAADSQ
jgi:hypothetical protein